MSHHKIWFITNFHQMQLISCPYKAFFTGLTFDLHFKIYLLTSDLNLTVRKTKSLCIKFTYWVYYMLRIEFLIKCSLVQVEIRHFNDFELWPWPLTLRSWRHIFLKSSSKIVPEIPCLQQLTWVSHGPPIFPHKLPDKKETNVIPMISLRLSHKKTCQWN